MENPQTFVNKIISIWQEHFKNNSEHTDNEWLTTNSSILNQIPQSNLLTVIFSFTDLSIFHINQAAADYFGASVEEIKTAGAALILSCFEEEQLKIATHATEISAIDFGNRPTMDLLNSFTCYTNLVIQNKKGVKNRAFLRIFPIQLNENGFPLTGMYLIYDVKPFVKENIWWYRSVLGKRTFSYYQSEERKFLNKDILSTRQKSLLALLASGLSSKEIALQLHVSSHTIDNHRRRMLAKTGAVDTSALIHIANLSGLL